MIDMIKLYAINGTKLIFYGILPLIGLTIFNYIYIRYIDNKVDSIVQNIINF